MRSQSWAIKADDQISFDFAVRWAADRGMTEIEVMPMLFLRFTSPEPTEKPWYATLGIGARLRVVRESGLDVYITSKLDALWSRGRLPAGNTSMIVALPYDPEKDLTPPVGVLCVVKPGISSSFPNGLWIVGMGNDGRPNVEVVL